MASQPSIQHQTAREFFVPRALPQLQAYLRLRCSNKAQQSNRPAQFSRSTPRSNEKTSTLSRAASSSPTTYTSSGEDTVSAFPMPQRPRDKPPAAAALSSGHESDGDEVASSCEIGENEAELVGRQPRQKRKGAAELAEKETSSASRLKKRKGDQAQSPPRKKRNKAKGKSASAYAADEVARSPSPEQDATAEESPTPNNDAATSVAAAGTPPRTAPADNATTTARAVSPKNDAYDAEKRLKEKSETYWHLWRMVLALEKDHGVCYKAAFLKMREDRARTLNNKFKRLCLREVSLQLLGKDNRVRVARAMLKNIPR